MKRLPSGYVFELEPDRDPFQAPSDDWDTVVRTAEGGEVLVGYRPIDGHRCAVFRCPDGAYRAVLDIGLES